VAVDDGDLAAEDDGDLAENTDELEGESATALVEELGGEAEDARDEGVTRSGA
jgi:hypothetical protein